MAARSIETILIANRGEIACRINRAAKALGMSVVQVASEADTDSLAARIADEVKVIGPPSAAKSYLNTDAILTAARESGADAIHPGYGFLSENADFADAVERAGFVFVGPTGDTIRLMGDKAAAREQARKVGVPTVPGSDGVITDMDAALTIAREVGFPVMIKASAGGGGRGIRIAQDAETFRTLASQAANEAKSAFGDGGIYIERVIETARHVEVQVLGDGTDVVHFYDRECSLQRRRQKVWEEAPSAALDDDTRERLCDAAVALARSVSYRGAGTVEFLYDDESGDFHFIEMNTRIQVEHPVTEMICDTDLVAGMIRVCGGEPLGLTQADIARKGHAIEVRLNAEDPANGFMPFPGQVSALRVPEGEGIRFDHMLYEGYAIPPFYDSLLGKLIVWAPDRKAAIARLEAALRDLEIGGLPTTAPLFTALARNADVQANAVHTRWLETWLEHAADTLTDQGETTT
ncbi:acetyl-CoA carboxylase biotin carboxylase subunit [Citreimonas sp.]|uniref:acetyl-CoA carboxylase biotin carboxylase subunit n=1 Tax=Citreimonas sp. TaxID=3036715 RepID=UPI00405923C7